MEGEQRVPMQFSAIFNVLKAHKLGRKKEESLNYLN